MLLAGSVTGSVTVDVQACVDVGAGVDLVLVRTMAAVADAQNSRPRKLSSPVQVWRSQAQAT